MAEDALFGLLSSIDPAQLQKLLATFGQPTPEMQAQADKQKWLTAGLGILAARPGNVLNAVGQGGLLGVQAGNESLHQQLAQRAAGVQQASGLLNLANQADQMNQTMAGRQVLQDFYKQRGMPNSPAATDSAPSSAAAIPTPPSGPADQGMPPATPAAVPPKTSVYQQYKQIGDLMAAKGAIAPAQQYYDLAEKYRPKLKETKTLTRDGQRVTVNFYDDGSTEVLPQLGPDQEKAHFLDTGNDIFPVDPITGKPIGSTGQVPVYPKTVTPGEAQSNALGYAHLAETKRYHNLELGIDENGNNTNLDGVAQAIAGYKQSPLSAWAMSKPMGAAIMAKVMEINPSYDAKNYATAQQTQNAFAKGPQGNTVRSIGVAMQHLDVLAQAGDALANGDVQAFNRLGNFVQTQLGRPAPTNFNAVKDLVANEITKAITGSGGGVSDRDKAQKTVDAANSPQQLAAVIDSYKKLFGGQLMGLEQQYKAGTQQGDFRQRFLAPGVGALLSGGSSQAAGPKVVDFNSLPK